MRCQACKQRPATVHLTEIIAGEKREKHLCDECAVGEGITGKNPKVMNDLMAKFIESQQSVREVAKLACPDCGMTFLQFRKSGLLGCPRDYQVFREPLLSLLERAHEGHQEHVGKVPGDRDNKGKRQHELLRLKEDLDRAIAAEEYERAALLRDKINGLEKA